MFWMSARPRGFSPAMVGVAGLEVCTPKLTLTTATSPTPHPHPHPTHPPPPKKPPGRLDELQHFAAARGDDEALLDYLMQRPDGATRWGGGLLLY
jgi:hypothetical protein